MFVRKKEHHGGGSAYHQLVESRRVDGAPRQKVVMHLGGHATVDEALKGWPREIKRLRRWAEEARKVLAVYNRDDPGAPAFARTALGQADGADKKADEVKAKLDRLRRMRAEGVA